MAFLRIIKPGLLTTIQDRGRFYFQEWGIQVAGAMDEYALRVGNILVGNAQDEGCLEITIFGPTIEFLAPGTIALTGADLGAVLNNRNCEPWQSFQVDKGDVLEFTGIREGCRAYLAVKGGFKIPKVMGSKSTYLRGRIGGLDGRALYEGDELDIEGENTVWEAEKKVPVDFRAEIENKQIIRVVPGPQDNAFTNKGFKTLLESEYIIRQDSDRMGCRLEGPKIEHVDKADIISDGIASGSIQVPGDGKPIVMMADRQTTGGYAKIATVITPDLWKLAQAKPGDCIQFSKITLKEAHDVYREYENTINQLSCKLIKKENKTKRFFLVKSTGIDYRVVIEEK